MCYLWFSPFFRVIVNCAPVYHVQRCDRLEFPFLFFSAVFLLSFLPPPLLLTPNFQFPCPSDKGSYRIFQGPSSHEVPPVSLLPLSSFLFSPFFYHLTQVARPPIKLFFAVMVVDGLPSWQLEIPSSGRVFVFCDVSSYRPQLGQFFNALRRFETISCSSVVLWLG